jgi:hypothetical protein
VYTGDVDDIDTCPGCEADANPISRRVASSAIRPDTLTEAQIVMLKKLYECAKDFREIAYSIESGEFILFDEAVEEAMDAMDDRR